MLNTSLATDRLSKQANHTPGEAEKVNALKEELNNYGIATTAWLK